MFQRIYDLFQIPLEMPFHLHELHKMLNCLWVYCSRMIIIFHCIKINIRVTVNIRNLRFHSILRNFSIFYDIFIIREHRNVVKCLLHSFGNIDKIFCKNANNIYKIKNSGNFKTDFFLNLYL